MKKIAYGLVALALAGVVGLGVSGAGYYGVFNPLELLFGVEQLPADTEAPNGAQPQTGTVVLSHLATEALFLNNNLDKTTVAGTRYYISTVVGTATPVTGIAVLIGGTGGTDNWLVELHDASGVLLATSNTAGALVGTAATWQKFAFTAVYNITPGTYFLTVQSNGTTAKLATRNAPLNALRPAWLTGSTTGTFGTGANFTAPTTYTANLGPIAMLY